MHPIFRAVTRAAVPFSEGFDEARWARAEAIVDASLAKRPAAVRRQVALFLRALDLLARLRFGRGLRDLEPARARRLLQSLERAPLVVLRRGVWGVRTLAFMGCYGQPETRAEIGYVAIPAGWAARGGGAGPWPERGGAAPREPGTLTAPAGEDGHA